MVQYIDVFIVLLLVFPLLGFLVNGWNWRSSKSFLSGSFACLMVGLSFLSSLLLFLNFLGRAVEERSYHLKLFSWIHLGSENMQFQAGVTVDPLSLLMILVITGVGLLIHIFSMGYMSSDPRPAKYFAYLNLFIFNMLLLVLADNLLLMFVGWEGVGLCSYFLIGFWFSDQAKAKAGMKAFITNRIGDAGFLLGLFFLFQSFGTVDFSQMAFQAAQDGESLKLTPILTWASFFLFLGAVGKSAQIPLYVWLPDAMAGPTPVSALIHAATMVTAGIYMIARLHFLFLFSPLVMHFIAIIGAVTAFVAATIAVTQWDIKKVLAYSTVSQLGYMFLGVGVGAFVPALFHLVTHAFFKALLFLGAGALIYAQNHEQDIRHMGGGLRKKLPLTYICWLCGWLALSGFPPLSGFFSKDEILWQSWQSPLGHPLLWVLGFVTAVITSFYATRLTAWIFWRPSSFLEGGKKEGESPLRKKGLKKIPFNMALPLIVLAFFSVFGGLLGVPHLISMVIPGHPPHLLHDWLSSFFVFSLEGEASFSKALEVSLMGLTVLAVSFAIWLAYDFYVAHPKRAEVFSSKLRKFRKVVSHQYYVDEFYFKKIIQPILDISHGIWKSIDIRFVDRITHWISDFFLSSSKSLSSLQRGKMQEYALYIVLGFAVGVFVLI